MVSRDQSRRFGMRGNSHSVVADHLVLAPQPGADRPIEFAGEKWEHHNLKKMSQLGQLPSRLLVFFRSRNELATGDNRKHGLALLQLLKRRQNRLRPLLASAPLRVALAR